MPLEIVRNDITKVATDGYENSSRKYTAERVKQMIERL